MTPPFDTTSPASPDSLVALLPVSWSKDELPLLLEVHPQAWAELLRLDPNQSTPARPVFRIGDGELDNLPSVTVDFEAPIPELNDLVDIAKHPFDATETLQLNRHQAIWRLTLSGLSAQPIEHARAFARLIHTVIEAGAPGVFFPSCFQLHSSQFIRHLSVELNAPQTLVNLFISAFNNDEWMVTRGLTAFGLPELETPTQGGLNGAYFRLLDVATETLLMTTAFRIGTTLWVGGQNFEVQAGPRGPDDQGLPVCGAYGRLAILPASL